MGDGLEKVLDSILSSIQEQNNILREISKKLDSEKLVSSAAFGTPRKTTTFDFAAKILADADLRLAENKKAAEGHFKQFGENLAKTPTD